MESYSLSEFLQAVQMVVRGSFTGQYWVRAEICSLSARPNGHCYMELAESAEAKFGAGGKENLAGYGAGSKEYLAKIKANCWRQTWAVVSAEFVQTVGQPLQVGMQVLAKVTVDFHPVYGMSLTVQDIDCSFTIGDLARRKAETLKRLQDEGIFDMQRELSLPTLPKRIAVISAASAAGYQDFVHQLNGTEKGYRFRTELFAATMQGDSAGASIIEALASIYEQEEQFDCVVIIRGGGATTDLSAFDGYELAAHCAQFPLPIIAGIGHTRDVSVVDQVVYASVKTPTAAAEYLIGLFAKQDALLDEWADRLQRTAQQQVTLRRQALDQTEMRIRLLIGGHWQQQRSQLDLMEKLIEMHSPERIFQMGYSLTRCHGEVVRSASQLQAGDRLQTMLADGVVESVVE